MPSKTRKLLSKSKTLKELDGNEKFSTLFDLYHKYGQAYNSNINGIDILEEYEPHLKYMTEKERSHRNSVDIIVKKYKRRLERVIGKKSYQKYIDDFNHDLTKDGHSVSNTCKTLKDKFPNFSLRKIHSKPSMLLANEMVIF